MTPTSSTPTGTNYSVDTKDFVVAISTAGKCWVIVTSSDSQVPLIEGVQPPGKKLSFPAQGAMTVQVGSSAVVVAISIRGKVVFYNAPHVTPYTYVVHPERPRAEPPVPVGLTRPPRPSRPGLTRLTASSASSWASRRAPFRSSIRTHCTNTGMRARKVKSSAPTHSSPAPAWVLPKV